MDWSRFGLERQPFRPSVDTDSYFPAATHESARSTIAAAFARREAFVLMDGSTGVGKTLVARKWLEHLLPDVPRVLVPSARAREPAELLQAILFDAGLPYQGLREQELRLAVTDRLLELTTETGYPTVLVLDESQHLSQAVLEELRLLGNLEARHGSALFTLLVAQPTLREILHGPGCELFVQRVGATARIEPLSQAEAVAYLAHHVRVAGGCAEAVYEEAALELLARCSGGVPRLLNRLAVRAMEAAGQAGASSVDVEAVLAACEQLGIDPSVLERTGEELSGASPSFRGNGLEKAEEAAQPVLLPHPARIVSSAEDEAAPRRKPNGKSARKRSA